MSRLSAVAADEGDSRARLLQILPEIEKVCLNSAPLDTVREPLDRMYEILASNTDEEDPLAHPLDLQRALQEPPPPPRFLYAPLIPAGRRVWMVGPTESGKSIFALWVACELTRRGARVVYVSQENPRDEEIGRLYRMQPDLSKLVMFHDAGLDLAQPKHARALRRQAEEADLVVIDTLSACWSGKEDDNTAVAQLDRDVFGPLIARTEASVIVIDHTGHKKIGEVRRGSTAARGASSKGQKADLTLEFISTKREHEFEIYPGKWRLTGTRKPAPMSLRVVDRPDESLAIETIEIGGGTVDDKAPELADAMVELIASNEDGITTNALDEAFPSFARATQKAARELLENEKPQRVAWKWEKRKTRGGTQNSKVWREVEHHSKGEQHG